MTINSEVRVAGPFNGNGVTTSFPFTFKVFSGDEVLVVRETGGVELVLGLGADYTVALNTDQDSAPGGSVILVAPLPAGYTLSLTSALAPLQSVDLTNQGGFYPRVINAALDRLTILIQQLSERLGRTLAVPISDGESGGTLPSANERKGTVLAFNEVTGAPQVGPTIAAVGTVVANTSAVNTVAGSIGGVNTVAANVADVTNFADVYYGPSATDPTLRRDGTPLQAGDLYFNTTIDALRSFNGIAWRGVPNGAITVQNLSGDGIKTEFLLDYAPENEAVTSVFISGVYQQKNTYGLGGAGGAWLIFDKAPPAGANNIEVVVSALQPSDDKLRQELASSSGAALVGVDPNRDYPAGTVGEKLRSISNEINIIVLERTRNISHYLTKAELEDSRSGNPVLDTTNALNNALNDRVGTVLFEGGFKVSGTGISCLSMNVATSIIGVGSRSTFIRADGAGQFTNLLNMNITDNGGLLDCRDLRIENLMLFHNGGGMHVIENTDGMPIFNAVIKNCNMLAPVGARDLVATKFAFSLIQNNNFGRGVTIGTPADPSADGNKLYDNLISGETGVILDIMEGAYCTTVSGGALVNRDCAIRIRTGSQIKIQNVQIEQQPEQSQSAERAHIVIEGVGRLSEGVRIENCNLGGGTNLDYLIYVNNAIYTDITGNTMNAPSIAELYLTANAQYTIPRRDNIVKGTVANPRPASRFPMMVVDNGYGTYNTLRTQPSPANGWSGGEFYKEENGDVVIHTGFNGGANNPNTVLATLPAGYRPADLYHLVAATATNPVVIKAAPDGVLTLMYTAASSAVGCQLRIPSKRG